MRLAVLALALGPAFVLAGTPADLPSTQGIDAPGQSRDQLIQAGQRCIKSTLKNEQFDIVQNTAASMLLGSSRPKAAPPLTTPDPSALLDTQADAGRIEGRHIFSTAGMVSEGVIQVDVTVDTKDNRFRITWHDAQYTAPIVYHWQAGLDPLIKEALPYKKAMEQLRATTDNLVKCIGSPTPADNW